MSNTSKEEGQKNLKTPKKGCSTSFETGCKPVLFFYLEIWGLANTFLTAILKQVLGLSCFLSFFLFVFSLFLLIFFPHLSFLFYFFVSFLYLSFFCIFFFNYLYLLTIFQNPFFLFFPNYYVSFFSSFFFLYFFHCYFALSPTQGALKKTFSLSLHSNIFPNDLVQSPPHNSVWMVLCAHARLSFLCLSPPTTTGTIQLSISQIFL